MLMFDPRKRISVSDALKHPYLAGIADSDLFGDSKVLYRQDGFCHIDVSYVFVTVHCAQPICAVAFCFGHVTVVVSITL